MKLVMGEYTDYYRPIPGKTYCEMLQANNLHQWSADGSNWESPSYWSESSTKKHLGGSKANYPKDGRKFLSFWGSKEGDAGGCCLSKHGTPEGWSKAFTLFYAQGKIVIMHDD